MTSPRSGNPVANQFVTTTKDGCYFQSYRTVIARCEEGRYQNGNVTFYKPTKIVLDPHWNYSRTTSKYLYQFLSMTRGDILKGIKDGSIIISDLN